VNPQIQLELLSNSLDFIVTATLDGTAYQIRFRWCDTLNGSVIADGATTGSWIMDINQPNGTPLLQGLRCVCGGWSMGKRFVTPGLPPGDLVFMDTSGQGLPPGILSTDPIVTDLGQRVQLIYNSAFPAPAAS
jgi:hypothetical protein